MQEFTKNWYRDVLSHHAPVDEADALAVELFDRVHLTPVGAGEAIVDAGMGFFRLQPRGWPAKDIVTGNGAVVTSERVIVWNSSVFSAGFKLPEICGSGTILRTFWLDDDEGSPLWNAGIMPEWVLYDLDEPPAIHLRHALHRVQIARLGGNTLQAELPYQPPERLIKTWKDAEQVAAEWLTRLGLGVAVVTQSGPDGGVDVRTEHCVAQVKMHGTPVGAPAVRELFGIAAAEHTQAVFFTLSGLTESAMRFANAVHMPVFEFNYQGQPTPLNDAATALMMR